MALSARVPAAGPATAACSSSLGLHPRLQIPGRYRWLKTERTGRRWCPRCVETFRSREARIVGTVEEYNDDDDADDNGSRTDVRCSGGALSVWSRFGWVLFAANLLLTTYCFTTLILSPLLTSLNLWPYQQRSELVLSPSPPLPESSSRSSSGSMAGPDHERPLSTHKAPHIQFRMQRPDQTPAEWSKHLEDDCWLMIQNDLQYCGYFSPGRVLNAAGGVTYASATGAAAGVAVE
ncbi:hypothetical protein GALMADRAFT_144638 [Galerina marginata CBS 339.88]|uniref:Uncharacterized protein n=1 Tax=Galerina marginata (strain CBS 339.88) TaxID=685588 RepID=A0A067SHA6_GALM3|nr:hypothetical protein GALMADRAFT_144638 [Galerina marginata CBS 339.88]